ncbi:hypothetical protein HP440_06240 [Bacillus altitudinis]|uniref:hypothetical protein n=1 Tax=Bacillus altitudinis TaxID=293387 RepID=UPI000D7CC37C|nr:hypothetical protein [Bacillus altitudinis]NQD50091.1 hypothetical protein [Bacillus altitudinis]PYH25678.1 hypothetical protein US8_03481 [Bacillus altitudinis]
MSNEKTTNSGEDQEELATAAETENVYPSSEILLSTITREYDAEANRKRDIETRAGVLIALLGALIGFYATALDFSFFKKANSPVEMLCFVIIALLFIFPAIMQLIAFKHLINVLKTYQYEALGIDGFNSENLENNAKRRKDELQFALTSTYHAVVKKNSIANDTKAKLFKKGTEKIYISIIGIVLVYLFKQIILLMV